MKDADVKGAGLPDASDALPGDAPRVLRAPGRKPGRRPKLSEAQRVAIADEVLSGRHTAAQMARRHGVSEPTLSRVMAAHRAAGSPKAEVLPDTNRQGVERIVGVLPLAALDQRLAIVGTSGSGKTYAAKGLVERLMDSGTRVCVVDPLGVWWGLRQAADGSAPGPSPVVVFGGPHADVVLTPGMGHALGLLVGTQALACVVDVSDLGSAGVRRAFMTDFTQALYLGNTQPLHLVLDEADLWAPQRIGADGHELLGRVEEIVRRGRVRGFVPWLITQRPAVLHKDVLSQADILVSMKLTSSQDRAAVGRWIDGQADRAAGQRILAALPRLARGEGWLWAPSESVLAKVAFPKIRSLDSSQTPHRIERHPAPGALAAADPARLAAALAAMAAGEDSGREEDGTHPGGRAQVAALRLRLRQREDELAAAQARVAELEASSVGA